MMTSALNNIQTLVAGSGLDVGFAALHVERGSAMDVNGATLFPTASTFKVPVMVEVYAQARAGKFALTDRLPFEERHRVIGSGVMQTLAAGLQPTIRDLIMLMNIVSDNTATDILCDLVGLEQVEARMRRLGLGSIHTPAACHGLFRRSFGLPFDGPVTYAQLKALSASMSLEPTTPAFARDATNNTASAIDLARLMALISEGKAGSSVDCADMVAILENQQYVDRVPRYLPLGTCANKTGSFRSLRNDIGLIRRGQGDTIAYAMLTLDPTALPPGNSRALVEANVRVAAMMGDVGQVLWNDF
jgi:beta-lactamase class A